MITKLGEIVYRAGKVENNPFADLQKKMTDAGMKPEKVSPFTIEWRKLHGAPKKAKNQPAKQQPKPAAMTTNAQSTAQQPSQPKKKNAKPANNNQKPKKNTGTPNTPKTTPTKPASTSAGVSTVSKQTGTSTAGKTTQQAGKSAGKEVAEQAAKKGLSWLKVGVPVGVGLGALGAGAYYMHNRRKALDLDAWDYSA